jgi:hypothetical protein
MRSVRRGRRDNAHCKHGCGFHAESVAPIIVHHSATVDVEEAVFMGFVPNNAAS